MAIRNTQPDDETVSDGQQLDPRDARALTEYMVAMPQGGSIFHVVGENHNDADADETDHYTVDAKRGRCDCPDMQRNLPDGDREECKHLARVRFATGERPIPGWVDPDDVSDLLGCALQRAEPRYAMTDGGRLFTESTERYEAVECREGDGEHLVYVDEPDERGKTCIGWTHVDGPANANKTVIRAELRSRGLSHAIADHGERFEPEVLRL